MRQYIPPAIPSCNNDPLKISSACLCCGIPITATTGTTSAQPITTSPTTTTGQSITSTTTSQITSTSMITSTSTSTSLTVTTTSPTTTHMVTAPATPIYNVVGNGNFLYDASAAGGLALWTIVGDAILVAGNAYHGDGNTGNYAIQLITGSTSPSRRLRRQTNGGAAGIEQLLAGLDMTTAYTVSCRITADYQV